jgi:hypothetical protein
MAVTLIVCGTFCVVAALGSSLWQAMHTSVASPAILMPGGQRGGIVFHWSGSLMLPILSIGVFLVGLAMIALGMWASLETGDGSRNLQTHSDQSSFAAPQHLDS